MGIVSIRQGCHALVPNQAQVR